MVSLLEEYEKRLKKLDPIQLIEIPNATSSLSEQQIKDKESDIILSKIQDDEFVVLLELRGTSFTSVELSKRLDKAKQTHSKITFVIGGSYGVNDAVRARANVMWKLSDLTFPHQFVRVMLYEQLYRAWMISENHPYHK